MDRIGILNYLVKTRSLLVSNKIRVFYVDIRTYVQCDSKVQPKLAKQVVKCIRPSTPPPPSARTVIWPGQLPGDHELDVFDDGFYLDDH